MDVGSIVNQGLIGMQKSQVSMHQSAQQIAQTATTARPTAEASSSSSTDLASSLVNLKVQSQLFDSSAKVVKTADEALGTLLDVKA